MVTSPALTGDVTIAGLLAGVIGAILATVLSQLLAMPRGVNVADAINDSIGRNGQAAADDLDRVLHDRVEREALERHHHVADDPGERSAIDDEKRECTVSGATR